MRHAELIQKRELFARSHPLGQDDSKAPVFYQNIIEQFYICAQTNQKYAFIVVAHMLHTLPFFLEAISTLGDITAIIPKQSFCVESVVRSLNNLYGDLIKNSINKGLLQKSDVDTETQLTILFPNETNYKYIILDHGGYFAPQIAALSRFKNIAGIVEHTWNGEIKYLKPKGDLSLYDPPVFSIARTPLKAMEDLEVAKSIVFSIASVIYSGMGINQDVGRLKKICVVGFGHLGKPIALFLRKIHSQSTFIIVDIDPEKRAEAAAEMHCISVSDVIDKQAIDSDLFIIATSTQSFKKEVFNKLENNACVVCVTSSDDLFTENGLQDYEKNTVDENKYVSKYTSKTNPKKVIYLAGDGRSVNFMIGSTAHPILHAIFAAVYVSALRLIEAVDLKNRIQVITPVDQDNILKKYKDTYGEIQTEIDDFIFSLRYRYLISRVSQVALLSGQDQRRTNIDDIFINLTIIREAEQKEKEAHFRSNAGARYDFSGRLSSYEDLRTAKEPIRLDEIFTPGTDTALPKKLLIMGRAGIGKSTLCQYIAHQWASQKLWPNFKAVFWIPLRNINSNNYPPNSYTWIDLVDHECFKDALSLENKKEGLKNAILANPERFLFLLDDYDELSPDAINGYLKNAFDGLKIQQYSLITSRPQQISALTPDRKLEIMGFSPKDIEAYAHQFFKQLGDVDTKRVTILLDFLKRQPMIWAIAHIPLQLSMICQLHADDKLIQPGEVKLTLSKLYYLLTENLFTKFLKRKGIYDGMGADDLEQKYNTLQTLNEQLAYNCMLQSKIFFTNENLNSTIKLNRQNPSKNFIDQCFEEISKSGLLCYTNVDQNTEYYFIHLTFQEYFAAGYIARKLRANDTEIKKIILDQRYNPRLEVMWWFVAGHLSNDIGSLNHFFDILMSEQSRDIIGIYEQRLLLRCLAESGEPKDLNIKRDQLLKPLLEALRNQNSHVKHVKYDAAYVLKCLDAAVPGIQIASEYLGEPVTEIFDQSYDELINIFFQIAKDKKDTYEISKTLTNLAIAVPEICVKICNELLSMLLQKDQDENVKYEIIKILRVFAVVAPSEMLIKIYNQLLSIFLVEQDERVKYKLAGKLGSLCKEAPEIRNKIFNQSLNMLITHDEKTKYAAAVILAYLGVAAKPEIHIMIFNQLQKMLEGDEIAQCTAIKALGVFSKAVSQFRDKIYNKLLLLLLRENQCHRIKHAVILALGNLGVAEPEIRAEICANLLKLFSQNEPDDIIEAATYALAEIVMVSGFSNLFNLLPENTDKNSKMLLVGIATVLADCFYNGCRDDAFALFALSYHPDTKELRYWERGEPKTRPLSLKNNAFLIKKIQEVSVKLTCFPVPSLTLPKSTKEFQRPKMGENENTFTENVKRFAANHKYTLFAAGAALVAACVVPKLVAKSKSFLP